MKMTFYFDREPVSDLILEPQDYSIKLTLQHLHGEPATAFVYLTAQDAQRLGERLIEESRALQEVGDA